MSRLRERSAVGRLSRRRQLRRPRALMMLAISREDLWSRFLAARLGCSVGRWLSFARDFLVTRLNNFVSLSPGTHFSG